METVNIRIKTNWFISGNQYPAGAVVNIPKEQFDAMEKQFDIKENASYKFWEKTEDEETHTYTYGS